MYEAGDNDPSTGGPDFVRNLFPMIVTISSDGFQELEHGVVAEVFRVINERRTESGGVAGGALR
jgi:proteasome beta subunit